MFFHLEVKQLPHMHALWCEKVEYLGNYYREQLNFMFQHDILPCGLSLAWKT